MGFGTACVLISLIVCVSVLIGIGMDYAHDTKEHEKEIERLEKLLEMEEKKK